METITAIDKQYVAGTYGRFPVELVSGKGSILQGSDGKEYIDMGSGIGVTSFGIADDMWLAAVSAQAAKLQHTSNLYFTEPCALLAKALDKAQCFKHRNGIVEVISPQTGVF